MNRSHCYSPLLQVVRWSFDLGPATEDSFYTLTVTTEGTSEYRADSGLSITAHIKAMQKAPIFVVAPYEGDTAALLATLVASEETYSWGYFLALGAAVGAAVWVWRVRKGKKGEDYLSYSLIGS